jgi:hypothetical protein
MLTVGVRCEVYMERSGRAVIYGPVGSALSGNPILNLNLTIRERGSVVLPATQYINSLMEDGKWLGGKEKEIKGILKLSKTRLFISVH